MDDFLLTLGALTLGGSAAILLLSLASRSTRSLYGARWRCWAWLLLCLRLAVPFPLLPQGQREAAGGGGAGDADGLPGLRLSRTRYRKKAGAVLLVTAAVKHVGKAV